MSGSKIVELLDGYEEIKKEIEVLRKYAVDRTIERGQVFRVVNRLHPKTVDLRVSEVIPETDSSATLRMVSDTDAPLPPFQAGQYVNLFVQAGGVRTSRPYSIASAPNQTGYWDLTIRRVADGFVSTYLLDEVQVGDRLQSTGPAGQFHHNPLFHGDDLVFIAGGSGITPMMSMIREATDRGLERRIHLIYGSRSETDRIFHKELEGRARRHGNLTVTHVISEPSDNWAGETGLITAQVIQNRVKDLAGKMFYVCGPEAMYGLVLAELEKIGVSRRRIRVEVFGPPADVTAQPGWPDTVSAGQCFQVSLAGGRTIEARAAEPLMNSLERAGIVVEACCRAGECSLCRTRLVSGEVFQPRGARLRKSDRRHGYIHPCMAYPLSDLTLDL